MDTLTRSGRRILPVVLAIVVTVAVWHLIATLLFTRANGSSGAVPPPLPVVARLGADLVDPSYWLALGETGGAALIGYLIAIAIAMALGIAVLAVPLLESFSLQVGVITACVPAAAVSPIIVLLSPSGSRAVSVVLAVLAVAFPMIIGVLVGLRASSPAQLDLVHAYGGGLLSTLVHVRVIAAVPASLAALKIGAPAAFLGAMTGEFFAVGVDNGVGRLLISQQYAGDYVGMWAVGILATLFSGAGYAVLAVLGRLVAPWSRAASGRYG